MPGSTVLDINLTAPLRCDLAVINELKKIGIQISRQKLKDLFKQGLILRKGRTLAPSFLLQPGHHPIDIQVESLASEMHARPSSQGSFIPVVYEDEFILVLNKPSGVPSVPHSVEETETAVGSALAHCPAIAQVGTKGLELGLLHRLDTETSGLLAFAKNNSSFEWLKHAWKTGAVKKIYRAVSSSPKNKPAPRAPLLCTPLLAHLAKSSKRMVVFNESQSRSNLIRGKPLQTHTRIIKIHPLGANRLDLTIEITTGVMHQIRCTLENIGWPIMGDLIYHGEQSERLWLHAWGLEFSTSNNSKKIRLEAPLPEPWPKALRSD